MVFFFSLFKLISETNGLVVFFLHYLEEDPGFLVNMELLQFAAIQKKKLRHNALENYNWV